MKSLVTRMLTTLSLMALLFVAVIVVRVKSWSAERGLVSVTVPEAFFVPVQASDLPINLDAMYASVALPEMEMPVVRIARARTPKRPAVQFMQINKEVKILEEVFAPTRMDSVEDVNGEWRQLQGSTTIPSDDVIVLKPVDTTMLETTSFVALMDNIQLPNEDKTEVAAAPTPAALEVQKDEVSTVLAAKQAPAEESVEAEPEFFDLEKVQTPPAEAKLETVAVTTQETAEPDYAIPEGWDLPVGTQKTKPVDTSIKVDDKLVSYGYVAPAGVQKTIPQAPVITHNSAKPVNTQKTNPAPVAQEEDAPEVNGFESTQGEVSMVTISPIAVGLAKNAGPLKNFEVRAKDDDAESWQDHNQGQVVWKESIANGTYSRGVVILHDDYVPTHADIFLAPGQEGNVEIPVISNEKIESFAVTAGNVPTGYVIVDLDEATENITLDGAAHKATRLTNDFAVTKGEDFRYVLFSGVEAGNRTMTIVRGDGKKAHRLIHVHEKEVTFDPNLFAKDEKLTIKLNEEDLLSRKKRSLVVASDKAQMFFSGEKAQKMSPSKYAFKSSARPLGTRQYLALGHQQEEIYVGIDGSGSVEVPSEPLMREVIRRFRLGGNSKACVVQINLDRPAKRYQVLAESYGEGHVSYGLTLDEDGQFYESMGEGSRRLFVMSENQSGSAYSDNAKLNVRIEYQDGSFRSFSSYCSPNSYLVEQL